MSKTILSINENRSMNYLLRTVLSKNYSLITVPDIMHGIAELRRKNKIDLIIVDIDYNTKESLDFIQHMKTSSLYKKPVIVLLSDENDIVSDKLSDADVYDYFKKPFSPKELTKSIDELMLTVNLI